MAEIEAKFLVRRPGQVDAALATLAAAGFARDSTLSFLQLDTYYDTRDWQLHRVGYAFRRRQRDDANVVALKSLGNGQGPVFVREELEQAADAAPGTLPPGPVADRLEALGIAPPGRKLFSVRTRRTRHAFSAGDGSAFRLDVDECVIRAHRPRPLAAGRLAFTELELELAAGPAEAVAAAAALLRDGAALVPARMSKFDRGLLAGGFAVPDTARGRSLPRPGRRDPVHQLLYRALEEQSRVIAAQEPVAWEGIDPEGVHRMRVATRRIRSWLREFSDLLSPGPLNAEFRWLAEQLGAARDADVGRADYAAHAALLSGETVALLAPFERRLDEDRLAAHENLDAAFASARYRSLGRAFGDFLAAGADFRGRVQSIEAVAAGRVQAMAARVFRRGDALGPDPAAEELHALRIVAKRLRYLLELFGTVQTRRWQKATAAAQALHDILGMHQDAVTGLRRLASCAESLPAAERTPEFTAALAELGALEQQRVRDCRERFRPAWSRLRSAFS